MRQVEHEMRDDVMCGLLGGWGRATLLQRRGLPHPRAALLVVVIDNSDTKIVK